MPITNIPVSGEIPNIGNIRQPTETPAAAGFADHFKAYVKDVNAEMHQAERVAEDFAAGKTNNIHETILAAERASIAFKLVGSIRMKALEAYQEVMRMPM